MSALDVVVVGAGPNGLTAAATLARQGLTVVVLEAASELGGGLRTQPLTLEGYRHDVCSAVHTLGCVSPAFEWLELTRHGLSWVHPPASAAHPLDQRPAILLEPSIDETARQLGPDAGAYARLIAPFLLARRHLFDDALAPLGLPRQPFTMARFGWLGLRSAQSLARSHFSGDAARALLAGCAAHSTQPLDHRVTAAFALIFLTTGHVKTWPVARTGSAAIASALEAVCRAHGVRFETQRSVRSLADLPEARVVLFDLAPRQLADIAGDALPHAYRDALRRYRMGPGTFKLDWALSEPIPWRDPRCSRASTVHLGGTIDEIAAAERAAWEGKQHERPFVLLTQQSLFDDSRAPAGKHTGYAYCHVPAGSDVDVTERIEAQIERFAPGFRDCILARHRLGPAELEAHNPSYIGGAVTGGAATLDQLFTRPLPRLDPYSTPNPKLFLCSHSTPPGAGVHGMCGFHAARSVLRKRFGRELSI